MRIPSQSYFKYVRNIVVFVLLVLAVQWTGVAFHSQGGLDAKVIEQSNVTDADTNILSKADPKVRAVMNIQNRHTDILMSNPGIAGTATGLTENGRPAILIFARSYVSAKAAALHDNIEGVPVIVKITGEIRALKGPSCATPPCSGDESAKGGGGKGGGNGGGWIDATARFYRPVPIGVSTGHADITAGTIGCRVTDGTNVYALSNNHVYANENMAFIGDNVLQPGTYDGGLDPQDSIGTLFDYEPIVFSTSASNTIDAAIALSTTDLLDKTTPSNGYGIPKAATFPAGINLKVMKYGRTTSETSGTVYAINATVDVAYDSGVARFVNQIVIIPIDVSRPFSGGGDSGSLIVVSKGKNSLKPVGLLFAGDGYYTIANPIDLVLDRFGVTVDGN
jgi:hypothetical protein